MHDVETIEAIFARDGVLAQALPGYEVRAEQVAFAQGLADALDAGGHFLGEAGTGSGKSLAYLIPALDPVTSQRPALLRSPLFTIHVVSMLFAYASFALAFVRPVAGETIVGKQRANIAAEIHGLFSARGCYGQPGSSSDRRDGHPTGAPCGPHSW